VWGYGGGVSGHGTYQQSGNVWEWCSDWYGDDYYGKSVPANPPGPDGGLCRVYRGGCWWDDDPSVFRGAYRYWIDPTYRYWFDPTNRSVLLGFRLVRIVS
jgi:formylglycine-generating enzyme required for sulfatase activity